VILFDPCYTTQEYYTHSLEENILDILEEDITKYAADGDIILMGDINARTGDQETDFIPNECISDHVPLFENYAPLEDHI
jgi:hypothetical protein